MSILKRILQRSQAQPESPPAKPAQKSAPSVQHRAEPLPPPPRARNNYVVVVLDSCRYDSFMAAAPPVLSHLGEVERRWSYASWTAPSHYNLLMGLLPHSSPHQVYASEYYKRDFLRYNERLGSEHVEFKSLIPHLFLPTFLSLHPKCHAPPSQHTARPPDTPLTTTGQGRSKGLRFPHDLISSLGSAPSPSTMCT